MYPYPGPQRGGRGGGRGGARGGFRGGFAGRGGFFALKQNFGQQNNQRMYQASALPALPQQMHIPKHNGIGNGYGTGYVTGGGYGAGGGYFVGPTNAQPAFHGNGNNGAYGPTGVQFFPVAITQNTYYGNAAADAQTKFYGNAGGIPQTAFHLNKGAYGPGGGKKIPGRILCLFLDTC